MAETIDNPDVDQVVKVKGDDVILWVDMDTTGSTPTWWPLVCLTTNSLNKTRATIDATTKCGSDTQPGNATYEATAEGQIVTPPDGVTTLVTEDYVDYWLKNKTKKHFFMGQAVPETGTRRDTFYGFFTQDNTTFAQNEMGTFSANIAITGTPVREVATVTDGVATWTEFDPTATS